MRIILFFTGVHLIHVMRINCDTKGNSIRQEMQKHAEECLKEMNVTPEEEQRFKTDKEFAELRMRCLSACIMKKSGEMGEDGKPNLEKISVIEHALDTKKAEETLEVISQCLEEVKSIQDQCDFANAYDDCVFKTLDKKALEILKLERIP